MKLHTITFRSCFDEITKTKSYLLGLALLILLIVSACARSPQQIASETVSESPKTLNQQVKKFIQQGRYSDVIPEAERALAIREKALGPKHPDVAQSLNNLAVLYANLGDYARAEPLYQRALAIGGKTVG